MAPLAAAAAAHARSNAAATTDARTLEYMRYMQWVLGRTIMKLVAWGLGLDVWGWWFGV